MKKSIKKYLIIGNPNAGKTTLFNALTGKNEKVGNWHGVTVENVSATAILNGEKVVFTDVPGIYSLKNRAAEEIKAAEAVKKRDYNAIITVIEAEKLGRGLKLVRELRSFNVPIIVFINLYGDFLKRGGKLDQEKLSESLGAKIICGEAIKSSDVKKLKDILSEDLQNLTPTYEKFYYKQPRSRNGALENLITGKFTALPVLLAILTACFWFSFGEKSPVSLLSGAISRLLNDFIGNRIYAALSPKNIFLARLLTEGVIGGLSGVAEFIPQICVLSFCLDFLEQSGYLSRISAFTDSFLRKFALTGKSLYSLSCGFGCTAVAAVAANGIDDERVKTRAVLSMPFVSCSAKTPIYFYLAKPIFKRYAFLVMLGIYLLSVTAPLLRSLFLSKTLVKGEPKPLIEEIADLKIPKFSTLSKSLLKTLKEFIIRLSTVVFCVSLAVWLGMSVSVKLELLTPEQADRSILASLGKLFAVFFSPLGFDWRLPAALFSGIFAKESVVSSLGLLFPEWLSISAAQCLALIAFCYVYTPCLTALSAIKKVSGIKRAVFVAAYQLLAAFAAMYAVYFITKLFI